MAKKRRLNRRVLIILGILLTLVLLVGGYGAYRYRDKLFPKDPALYAARGDEAYARGDYGAAVRAYRVAAGAGKSAIYYYKLARVELDWALKAQDLKDVERRRHYEQGRGFLNHALLLDARLVDAQRLRCDLVWDEAVTRGSWETFLREADKLLALDAKDHKTLFRRATADARLYATVKGEHAERAEKGFRQAIELAPAQVEYWMGLAQLQAQCAGTAQVRETYLQAVKVNPASTLLRVNFAEFLRRSELKEEARKQFEQAIQNAPGEALGYLCLAGFYLTENALAEATAVLEKGKHAAGNDYRLFRDLARIYARGGEPARAVQELRRGLALSATTRPAEEARSSFEDGRWQMTYLLINSLLDLAETDASEKDKLLAEAEQTLTGLDQDKKQTPHYAKLAGRVAMTRGQQAQAAELLEKAWNGFGSAIDQQTANLLIHLYLAQNLPGKAEKIIDRILASPGQRNNAMAMLAKASLLMRYRDYVSAYRYVHVVRQRYPDNADARNLEATLQALVADAPSLAQGVQYTPQSVALLLERSSVLWFNEKRGEALALVEQLAQVEPRNLAVASQLISMYLMGDQRDKLEVLMARLQKDFPDNQEIQFQTALVKEKEPARRLAMRLERAEKVADPYDRCLAKADIYALQGNQEQYVAQLTQALAHKPAQPEVLERLFRHALTRTQWDLAEKTLADIVKANLDGCEGKLYSAELALARGQASAGAGLLEQALQARPDMKRARTLLGECRLAEGKLDQAEQAFAAVAGDDPAFAPAVIGMAQVTERLGRIEEHEQWVERGHRLAPSNTYIRQQYLIVRAAQAGPKEIQQLIQQRERMLQQETSPQLSNRLHLAVLYERAGEMDKAEQALRLVYEKAAAAQKLAAGRLLAGLLVRRDRVAQAEQIMQNLLDSGADKVGTYLLYGEVIAHRSIEQALSLYQKAQAADPKDVRPSLATARLYARLNRWNEAATAMKRHVDLNPADRSALKELVRYCVESGQIELARTRLDQVLLTNRNDMEALILRGALLLREGQATDALQVFHQAVQEHPDQALPLVWRSQAHSAMANIEAAVADLRKAQQMTVDADLLLQIADRYLWIQDMPSAEAVLTALLQRQRTNSAASGRLIAIYTLQQKWPALETVLAEARRSNPLDAPLALAEAQMWTRRQQHARAAAVFETLRGQGVQSPALTAEHVQALLAANEPEKALALLTAGQEPVDKALRGRVLHRQRQTAQAEELFRQAVSSATGRTLAQVVQHIEQALGAAADQKLSAWSANLEQGAAALLYLADLHVQAALAGNKERYAQAERLARAALERAARPADKIQAQRRLALVYSSTGRASQAEAAYLSVLQTQGDDTQSLNNLAYLYANDLDQPAKALPYAQKALELARNDANVLDTLGWALARSGQYEPARQMLLRAIQAGGAAASCYHMGWALENQPPGLLEQANQYYRMGLQLAPQAREDAVWQLLEQSVERIGQKTLARSGK